MRRFLAIQIALLSILSSTICAQTQNVDSLINILNTQQLAPDEQLDLYWDICEYYHTNDLEKCRIYAEKGLVLSKKGGGDKRPIVVFNNYLGIYYYRKKNPDTGMSHFEQALAVAQKAKLYDDEAWIYGNIATMLYTTQSNHEQALNYFIKALNLYEKMGLKKSIMYGRILGNIANMYIALYNYDRGIYYLEQAKVIYEELNDLPGIVSCYYNFGMAYMEKGEYAKAIEQELKALELNQSAEAKYVEISIRSILAKIYSDGLKDYDQAEKHVNEAIRLAEEFAALEKIMSSRLRLSEIQFNQKRYKESDANASWVWEMDTVFVNLERRKFAAKNIVLANIFLGNKTKAASFFAKFLDYVNQANTESFHKSLSEMEVKYETEKKELHIAQLEQEKRFYIWLGIVGGILLLSLSLLFFIVHRLAVNKQKLAEQQIKQLEQEKKIIATQSVLDGETAERTRLARDLHDGLGGMLSVVKLNLDDVEHLQNAREMLDQSISELRRVAHHMMPASLLRYGLKPTLEDFCKSVSNVQFHYFGEDSRLNDRIEILIYRCVLELVNNAIKYANASTINVQLVQDDALISLTVEDDGCGFDMETVETPNLGVSTGMGLKNLRDRVEACNGKINIYSLPGKGTEVLVELSL
ncbi:hypothetical protein FACS189437_04070 [Bacteroidia bacterium]|nr:hypothetical protein FACS189437_04070 [Bacteroidia bacterium]